jgi:citrate lyase subunit beta/citryl-CoA lyase
MPGSNARAMQKARTLPCDVVILDLEDAVAPDLKHDARDAVCAAVRERRFGRREVVVRVNALSSSWGEADLSAVRTAKPDAILLPKVKDAADIAAVSGGGIPIWAMIETTSAILNLASIAASGAALLVMGTNDLIKEMVAAPMPGRENLWFALSQTVTAARAHGLGVIDDTYNGIGDEIGFRDSCEQGKAFGFDGKSVIHPSQIAVANRVFAPSAQALTEASRILAAFAAHPGKGAIQLDGRMVERLHAEAAARLLALADAIAAANDT